MTSGLQGLGGKITELSNRDPRSFVAGPSALQSQVFGDAGKLTTSPRFGEAGGIFSDVSKAGANTYDSEDWTSQGYDPTSYNASSVLENIDKYMSPYTQDVVNTSLADYDYGAGQTRANQALEEARSGAFGGSGAAITRSMTEDALTRGRGTLAAGLRDTGFTRGAGLSATDAGFRNQALAANAAAANQAAQFRAAAANQAAAANAAARNQALQYNAGAADTALARQLAAGGAIANLGATEGADTRANLALQGQLGADQRAIEQAIAGAPLSVLQALSGTFGGLPLGLLSGETTTGNSTTTGTTKTSDPWGVISKLAQTAGQAYAASDIRLKADIEKLGEREDGLGVYSFRYIWSPVRHIGVMAQEVLKVKPEAVAVMPSGYLAVNYGAL
ncbi:tail fiber domain-containing protein [Phenylobacterium sp.]|uniref:tail fiber domain-containing protein n=1 Tax=Phenylobacterium sp. TaxID=1871053 RepID=UPI0025D3E3DE|nr:tail fiber domain-containing protein [Phenylobacterium sp.]MCA6319943.1 tail fiber domain-containing protein [Phenylobacterium sp.]